MLCKDQAICIRKTDYSETSQIVTLLTKEHGKISAIAKGARRTKSTVFSGAIELFSTGEIVFSMPESAKLATLTEFDQIPLYPGLTRSLYNLNCALFSAELINKMVDQHNPHRELFELFAEFLSNIQSCRTKEQSLSRLIKFQIDLLLELGTGFVFNRCVNCSRKFSSSWNEVYFSSESNGFICRDCEAPFVDKIRLAQKIYTVLANLELLNQADFKTISLIEKLLIHHFTCILHKPPRTARFFSN